VKNCNCVIPPCLNGTLREIIHHSVCGSPMDIMEEHCVDYTAGLISFLNGGMQSNGAILSSQDIERVREARRILEEHLENPPNLIELSHHVGLNDYKLKTGFRQAYGKTMHQVLTEFRLKKAEELLLSGKGTIAEAAIASGFRNPGDFSRVFKCRYGSCPCRYRMERSAERQSPA
jgi:AraC family transcriptional regulator, transcriptional activator of the genes for pyochelin and ferripyochelin receptors